MASYLVVDIETVRDPELAWDATKQGFPPPPIHQVVAIGAIWLDEKHHFSRMGSFGGDESGPPDERGMLKDFAQFVGRSRPDLITYNGRGFDLPVLTNRCLKHGLSFPAYFANRDYRYRYTERGHLDLLDTLTDYGAATRTKLDVFTQLIGLPGKMEVDGSMVQGMYDQGKYKEIRDYCLHDVAQTAFLFLRTQRLRGILHSDEYREAATVLWNAMEADERTQEVIRRSNRKQLLLEDDSR